MSYAPAIFQYRNRAEAIRAIRARTVEPGIRRLLDDVADDYEMLADILNRIDMTQAVIAKHLPL